MTLPALRWRRLAAVTGAFGILLAVAVLPEESPAHAAAPRRVTPRVLPGEPSPLGMPFLPTPSPMHVTIDNLTAVGLTVNNNVTIRLSDGTTVTTTQYTFTQLQVNSHMHVAHTAPDGTALTIDIPGSGSLGGLDTAGQPETTVMWGTIDNICVTVIIPICGVQGLLNFFGSFIKLNAGASGFDARVYGIRTTDNHAALSSTNNPVHLPGTITVTTP